MNAKNNTLLTLLFLLVFNFSNAQVTIRGTIATERGVPVENVIVSISGSLEENTLTDEDGIYEFSVPSGGDYVIRPCYSAFALNGVSLFDLVVITKYASGLEQLDSPYKIIAADLDQNELIDTLDASVIRQLFITPSAIPNGRSWRFVEESFTFPDPLNPFSTSFPEEGIVNNLENSIAINFVGIKVGDVNLSALPALAASPDDLANGCSNIVSNHSVFQNQEIKAFPNPFDNQFTIDLGKEYRQTGVEVYSSAGLQLRKGIHYDTQLITVNFDHELSGVYFIKLIFEDKAQWIPMVKG